MNRNILIIILTALVLSSSGQSLSGITEEESALYAQTKQVNQFFRRFNNEEDRYGKRYYPGDKEYRDPEFRNVYLNMLFDKESPFIQQSLKEEFIATVNAKDDPFFLDFHGKDWFAELATTFKYNKMTVNPILFLQLEQENQGYKWVITNVYFDQFLKEFNKGEKDRIEKSFLHPMSHELDFMNLYKAFRDVKYAEYYANEGYKPDYKTLFFWEIKQGNLTFEQVGDLKFHFFQVDGWYFEVSFFNRPGNNSGWLISKLYKITPEEKEALIKFYLP